MDIGQNIVTHYDMFAVLSMGDYCLSLCRDYIRYNLYLNKVIRRYGYYKPVVIYSCYSRGLNYF